MPVIRRVVDQEAVSQMWNKLSIGQFSPGLDCPSCARATAEVEMEASGNSFHLDVCKRCRFVWFDPRELERLPPLPPALPPEEPLSQEQREKIAIAKVRHMADEAQHNTDSPDAVWKWIPAMLGMPVEHRVKAVKALPWATWCIAILCVLATVYSTGQIERVVKNFGLLPSEPLRYGGLTWLTSFFLHAGWIHLLGNLYFLIVFGDNVEDTLGRWKYLALILMAAVAGDLAHIAFDSRSHVPLVGASGGISGIIVFYALQFPHAKLGVFFFAWIPIRWLLVPAWSALILWTLLQGVGVVYQISGFSNVSALAHLGGAIVGAVAWLALRSRHR